MAERQPRLKATTMREWYESFGVTMADEEEREIMESYTSNDKHLTIPTNPYSDEDEEDGSQIDAADFAHRWTSTTTSQPFSKGR